MLTFDLSEPSATAVAACGGKGASLARLVELGLPVPAGFVVSCAALEQSLRDHAQQLRETISAAGDPARRGDCATRAIEILRSTSLPGPLDDEIRVRYAELGDAEPVAVRSSAAAEDGEAASYAGQQETYLNVRGADSVIERIRSCWESYFTERALFYRAERGSLDDLGMAVVVQRQVDSDAAGIMFTIEPVNGRKDRILVEAVLGQGEAAVSGEVTPDHYLLKRDGSVVRETIAAQPFMIRALPEGGTEKVALAPGHGDRRKLEVPVLAKLAEIGCLLHDRLGAPQDVEWAISDGELYVLQARPITA